MKREVEVVGQLKLPGVERSAGRVRGFVRDALGPCHPSLDDVQMLRQRGGDQRHRPHCFR